MLLRVTEEVADTDTVSHQSKSLAVQSEGGSKVERGSQIMKVQP